MKSFTPRENDLATLVLRIDGPRLLYGFQQLNMLPSESSVYKKLRDKKELHKQQTLIEKKRVREQREEYKEKTKEAVSKRKAL